MSLVIQGLFLGKQYDCVSTEVDVLCKLIMKCKTVKITLFDWNSEMHSEMFNCA